MGTVGNTTTPAAGWHFTGVSSFNVHAELFTMPDTGLISSVSFYADADSGTSVFRGVIWSNAGAILAQSADTSVTAGSRSGGGQHWHTVSLVAPIVVSKNTQIYIGWWRRANQNEVWSVGSAGGAKWLSDSSSSAPPAFLGGSSQSSPDNDIGAYATYTLVGVHRKKAGVQVASTLYRKKLGVWVVCTLYRKKAGIWVACN